VSGRDGFRQVLHAEWTKFRTVRGWVVGAGIAAALMVLFGVLAGAGSHTERAGGAGPAPGRNAAPIGPDGEAVNDAFYFVRQPLDGDGTLTARVTSLTGTAVALDGGSPSGDGLQPWTKAGVIVKDGTTPGSRYAAVMVTGGHGVRMQYNYTHDKAGPVGAVSGTSPRWLRVTRNGDTITGYASTDGSTWTTLGTVRLAGLPSTVQIGLFVASPGWNSFEQQLGSVSSSGGPTVATAAFDSVDLHGGGTGGAWNGLEVGSDHRDPQTAGGFDTAGDTFSVKGSGNIAPNVDGADRGIERTLGGAFAALTVVVVLGVLFISTEYRRGLIRTTLAATPRRGRVLAAKAVVIGAVTFVTGLVGAVIAVQLGEWILRRNGNPMVPLPWTTDVRIVVGTAALLAVAAVLALAVGTILRRSAGAVTAIVVLTVLPYILAMASVLPAGPAQWLLRLSPAAAFAVQQSVQAYPQVDQAYTPAFGFFPLAPWAGFAVLCGWAAGALGVATYLLRRRDA
jgi:ABC-type transport system involved in multi-copper enzyme maturation permease subunit